MNALDLTILLILLFFLISSYFRGFIRELFSLGGLIIAIVCANYFYLISGSVYGLFVSNPDIANTLGYITIIIGISILAHFVGTAAKKAISFTPLNVVDKSLGMSFGLIKGLIVVSLAVFVAVAMLDPNKPFVKDSRLRPHVQSIYSIVPKTIKKRSAVRYQKQIPENGMTAVADK